MREGERVDKEEGRRKGGGREGGREIERKGMRDGGGEDGGNKRKVMLYHYYVNYYTVLCFCRIAIHFIVLTNSIQSTIQ